jgi:hypothetical protein
MRCLSNARRLSFGDKDQVIQSAAAKCPQVIQRTPRFGPYPDRVIWYPVPARDCLEVLSARWSGNHGEDAANTALLLAQLRDVPDERRGGPGGDRSSPSTLARG